MDRVLSSWTTRRRLNKTVRQKKRFFQDAAAQQSHIHVRTAVKRCLKYATERQCTDLPVFMPGSDIFEAAQHDMDAIAGNGTQNGVVVGDGKTPLTNTYSGAETAVLEEHQGVRWFMGWP